MDIERVNEHTVKLYMSYGDIEERGLDKDDIWENREKSEQLFWDMIDEINLHDEFIIEGPLWIQVQVLDKGIEIMVTKAQFSKDGKKIELPFELEKKLDVESIYDIQDEEGTELTEISDGVIEFFVQFRDLEDVISLAHRLEDVKFESSMYCYKNTYYMYFLFDEVDLSEEEIENAIGFITEYGDESPKTVHWIGEYGKRIIEKDALKVIKENFPFRE